MTKKLLENSTPDLIKNPLPEVARSTAESSYQKLSSGIKDTIGLLTGVLVLGASINGAINNPR